METSHLDSRSMKCLAVAVALKPTSLLEVICIVLVTEKMNVAASSH